MSEKENGALIDVLLKSGRGKVDIRLLAFEGKRERNTYTTSEKRKRRTKILLAKERSCRLLTCTGMD